MHACINLNAGETPVFFTDAWFLRDCIKHHTPLQDEVGSYLTGQCMGHFYLLSRICAVEAQVQSPVRFIGTSRSSASRLIEILDNGNKLHATFHSHPGGGPSATTPSCIDRRYMSSLQKRGAKVLGLICTRDGYIRAYSPLMPFLFIVQGNGVEPVEGEDHVIRIALADPRH